MKNKFKRKSGITLVSLVLTIIILLILSTVAIQSLTHTGMFKRAQEAKDKMENAKKDEQIILGQYIDELNKQTQNEKYDKTKGVNKPELMQGMKAVKFTIIMQKNGQMHKQKMEVCGYGYQDMLIKFIKRMV